MTVKLINRLGQIEHRIRINRDIYHRPMAIRFNNVTYEYHGTWIRGKSLIAFYHAN